MPGLDREEFGARFAQAVRLLWVVAAAYVPRTAVDDVLQEAALVGLTRLDRFRPASDFRAWMTQIVRHVASNHRRRLRRLPVADDDVEVAADPAPADAVARDGTLCEGQAAFDDQVVSALATLTDDARACLLLHVVLGLGHAEVGSVLSLPEGTVASHVHRARKALRAALSLAMQPSGDPR